MAPVDEKPEAEAEVEDTPAVKELKRIDDKFLELEKEHQREINKLIEKYNDLQKPLLEERAKKLASENGDASASTTGTPAVPGFWRQALLNHPAFEDEIEDWDKPVLAYIKDIITVDLDTADRRKGFRLKFHFASNPYFENAVLSKEYHTEEASPYTGEMTIKEIRGCDIQWKAGKDVTVETAKKEKGKKTGNRGKASKEPRNSFFRNFFRTLREGGRLPDDVDPHELMMRCGAMEDDIDEEKLVEVLMDNDHDVGTALRDNVIPFAVRWYTGEAAPEGGSDDDEGSEEEDDEDDSDEESESAPKKKGNRAAPAGGDAKKEECKQQ